MDIASNVPLDELDRLWDFDHPAESERRFAALVPRASQEDGGRLLAELLTQYARAQGLQRRFEDADRTLDDAESALGRGDERARVRVLLERGRIENTANREGRGRAFFVEAWERAGASGEDALAVDAAHMLGIVEPPDEARTWNERAIALARGSPDPVARRWVASLANNMAWAWHDAGEYEEALELFELALEERLHDGRPTQTRVARWSVARCLRSFGRVDEALAEQRALRDELDALGETDGYVYEEIAECLLALGRDDEARAFFARAYDERSADRLRADDSERLDRLRVLGDA